MPKYQWDISDPLACAGLYFGTGDEFRTGQAAGPGTIEEQWAVGRRAEGAVRARHRFLAPADPGSAGNAWASSPGCRCAAKCCRALEEPFVVGSSNLDELLELAYWLIRLRMVNECFILNNTNLAAMFAKKWPGDYRQRSGLPCPRGPSSTRSPATSISRRNGSASQVKDITDITQRLGIEAVRAVGGTFGQ